MFLRATSIKPYLPRLLAALALMAVGLVLVSLPTGAQALPAKSSYPFVHNQPHDTSALTVTPSCGMAWRVVPSPNFVSDDNFLGSIAALSSDDIWVVGNGTMHWDGHEWGVISNPYGGILRGVAAVSSNDVWAVGGSGATLTMHWNGQAWSIVPSPNAGSGWNQLNAVTAVSWDDVWAVGFYDVGVTYMTMIMHWDGSEWSIVPNGLPAALGAMNALEGIAAVSASDVWAVGWANEFVARTLIKHWNGSTWMRVGSPNVGTSDDNFLYDIAAVSSTDIWAVGEAWDSGTLVLRWDGLRWSVVPTNINGVLYGVAAVSPDDVWAVGLVDNSTLVMHWDGDKWSVVPSPSVGTRANSLSGIAAVSATDIWAVGDYNSESGNRQTLIEHAVSEPGATYTPICPITRTPTATRTRAPTETPTATPTATDTPVVTSTSTPLCRPGWNVVHSPNVGQGRNYLTGVAAASANDVWAVGYYCRLDCSSNDHRTLIERWDGDRWNVLPSPNVEAWANYLMGVAVASADDVWAVGYYCSSGCAGGDYRTLTAHWDGTQWTIVPSPNVGTDSNALNGVASVSSNDVWAVGYFGVNTLIMRWDGGRWNVVPSPNGYRTPSKLYGVAALSPDDAWAVGHSSYGRYREPLFLHWDGIQWNIVEDGGSPRDGNLHIEIHGVAPLSSHEAWAVGSLENLGSTGETFIEHWDGGTYWEYAGSPGAASYLNRLYGVSVVSANDIWAVGYYRTDLYARTLTVRWNGTQWSLVPSPNVGPGINYLKGVASVAADNVWAIGYYNQWGIARTLIEHWTGETGSGCPNPVPTGTATSVPPTPTPTRCAPDFTDVRPTDYFYQAVSYLYCRGVVSGYPDSTFRPYNSTTRGQLTKIVVLAEGRPIYTPPTPTFSDVPPGHTFYQYVETAYEHGVISGYGDGTFRPGNNVTRGQLCKVVVLARGWPIVAGTQHFTDVPSDNAFFGYVETAYERGVVSGYGDGTFRPGSAATRAQVGVVVYRAYTLP